MTKRLYYFPAALWASNKVFNFYGWQPLLSDNHQDEISNKVFNWKTSSENELRSCVIKFLTGTLVEATPNWEPGSVEA